MPNPKRKLAIIIAIIILILVLLGGLLYWLLFGHLEITGLPDNSRVVINGQESNVSSKFTKKLFIGEYLVQILAENYIPYNQSIKINPLKTVRIDEPLKPFILSKALASSVTSISNSKDQSLYYFINEGSLYRADKNFNNELLSANTMKDMNKLFWSPEQKLALGLKNNQAQLFDFKQYDFLNQTVTPWSDYIKSALWLDSERIIYYYAPPTGEKSLISTNKANTEKTVLLDLRPYVQDNSDLILVPGSNLDVFVIGKDVIKFNLSTRVPTTITNSGNIVKGVISPDQKYLALLTKDSLVYYDIVNNKIINTDAKPTIANVSWSNTKTYFISKGKIGVIEPSNPKTEFLNSAEISILNQTIEMLTIEKTLVILANKQLFNISLE